MNKLKILILSLITLGLIASPAIAADRLSNADFFYGETITNPVEPANTASIAVNQPENIRNPATLLSAADFFYGDTIPNQLQAVKPVTHEQNTPSVAAAKNQLKPAVFFGYTDTNRVDVDCNC